MQIKSWPKHKVIEFKLNKLLPKHKTIRFKRYIIYFMACNPDYKIGIVKLG